MKKKIYNFFTLFTKVSRFFSRLAVEFEIKRYVTNVLTNATIITPLETLNIVEHLFSEPKFIALIDKWIYLKMNNTI